MATKATSQMGGQPGQSRTPTMTSNMQPPLRQSSMLKKYAYNPYAISSSKSAAAGASTTTAMSSMSLIDLIAKDVAELADKFKLDDDTKQQGQRSKYSYLEKSKVLLDARIFHDSILVRENPSRCCTIITQILHLQNCGQQPLNSSEATEVFFGVTKLFMSDDPALRRMVYLFLKEMAEYCDHSDVIIVTSCLTKDMTCDVDLYRANALRVLAKIVDSSLLSAIERYVKQAMVDKSSAVSSAALTSASLWYMTNADCAAIVKRWIREAQEAVSSKTEMIQYQALQLMYQIKSRDRLGVSKLVTQLSDKNTLKSPLAIVLLVRFTCEMICEEFHRGKDMSTQLSRTGYNFLASCLSHSSTMVTYEAARAVCRIPEIESQDVNPAVSALQMLLSSSKPTVRFASVKTLAEVASIHPRLVAKCNDELEALIRDANRSIGTLAITALLRTGNEANIDRLLRQISAFLSDIPDEYKIMVVRSLQQLCLMYPSRHRALIAFLANFLREEGGYEFKKSIVNTIIDLMRTLPETIESSLLHLCEFIEDCEFATLSTLILHLLAELGPKAPSPARFVRFIYNRTMLENASVRAASVSALATFAASVPSLRGGIMPLLKPSLTDEDDETRDRAAVAISVLKIAMEENAYAPNPDHDEVEQSPMLSLREDDIASIFYLQPLPLSFNDLERSLSAYISNPEALTKMDRLTFDSIPVAEEVAPTAALSVSESDATATGNSVQMNGFHGVSKKERMDPAAAVYAVPEFAALGRAFRSCAAVDLTESETEYVATCIKHIFTKHVVLQFRVQNTVEDQRLDNVTVSVECTEPERFEVAGEVSSSSIKYGSDGSCFTLLTRPDDQTLATVSFACEMHFTVTPVDSSSGEEVGDKFTEEYPLEHLQLTTSDFMAKSAVSDFRRSWEQLGNANEILEKFALQFKSLEEAVPAVIKFMGMHPCDGTGVVKANAGGKPHMLHLSGIFVGDATVLARAQLALQPQTGVILKIAVRSEDKSVSRLVASCIS